ncbi:MarR family winged helix-turn-helix transcriptional regulator [Ohtaekwangia koreensis]|uniref:DNA-binding transcriptional regulator, MarR family n=1 Tax=Ohtaekwangia koreensis TaxID=688867 RepID=A0A1T5M0Q4_9BACT|nr:MarR family transcriptional regulator [Ohtaekwangia koreensis]SKC81703.1 DNA-binding transcriptional regulator, MarR family [Ohtaekwangia koreensis]
MNKSTGTDSFKAASRKYSDTSILMHEAISRKAGLSGTDHKYLGLLIQEGPMTAGELSQRTGLTGGAITGLMDRLEKKKLAKREFDKEDRRKVFIVANEANAMKLLAPLFKELQQKTAKLLNSYSDKEIEIIKKYMLDATEVMNEVLENLKK